MTSSEISKLETDVGQAALWPREHKNVLGPNVLMNTKAQKISKQIPELSSRLHRPFEDIALEFAQLMNVCQRVQEVKEALPESDAFKTRRRMRRILEVVKEAAFARKLEDEREFALLNNRAIILDNVVESSLVKLDVHVDFVAEHFVSVRVGTWHTVLLEDNE